jgi:FkbM family methyltransferase
MEFMRKTKLIAYRALNRPSLRFILALFAAIYATVRVRKLCSVTHDGEWVQRFPSGTLVEPRLTLFTLEQIEKSACDLWMHQYLPGEGETVVDVGAGTGWETLVFSRRVGKSGRVISIEAHPRVFSCLSRMCAENRLENVTLIHAAIMDHGGEVLITDGADHLENRIVGTDSGIPIPGITLDQVFRSMELPKVDFLKMNIEGAERTALAGMREMVRRTRYVCISCHDFAANEGYPEVMRTKSEVIAFLRENRFSIFMRQSDPRPAVRDYVYGLNLEFITDEQNCRLQRFVYT